MSENQHIQIGESTFERNAHGVIIEHSKWVPSALSDGRCCGRKPLVYKRPKHRLFCLKCCREYSPDGEQNPNFAFVCLGPVFIRAEPRQDLYKQDAAP